MKKADHGIYEADHEQKSIQGVELVGAAYGANSNTGGHTRVLRFATELLKNPLKRFQTSNLLEAQDKEASARL